jgi:hypothetical protein
MNIHIFKDRKIVLGFIVSLFLNVLAIVFAIKDNDFWLIFFISSLIISSLSIGRIGKLDKERKDS